MCFIFSPVGITESDAVQQAIQDSLCRHEHVEDDVSEGTTDPNILSSEAFTTLIKQHAAEKIKGDSREIVISRISMWQTAQPYFKRKGFLNGSGLLKVTFATFEEEEDAVDLGGPRREFFHLLLAAIIKESGTVISKMQT